MIVIEWQHLVGVVTIIGLVYVIFEYKQRRREKLNKRLNNVVSNNSNGKSKSNEDIILVKTDIVNIKKDVVKTDNKIDNHIKDTQDIWSKIEVHMGVQVEVNKNIKESIKDIWEKLNK